MIAALPPQQRRALAVAILVLLLAGVFMLAVLPLWSANRHLQETAAGMEDRLQALQRTAAITSRLQPQYEQLRRWQTSEAHYLKSSTPALAAAELQHLVKRLTDTNRVEVLSTQILAARQEQALTQVGLKVRLQGTLENVVAAFHAIETGEPFLFLDNVSLQSRAGRGRRVSGPSPLDIELELFGYLPGDQS